MIMYGDGVVSSLGVGTEVPHKGLLCVLGDDHHSSVGGLHDDVQLFFSGLPDDIFPVLDPTDFPSSTYTNQSDATTLSSSQSSPLYHIPPELTLHDGV